MYFDKKTLLAYFRYFQPKSTHIPFFSNQKRRPARGPPPTPCSHQTRVSAYFNQNRHISRVSCISNLKRRFSEKSTAHQTQLSAYFDRNPAYFDQNPHFKHGGSKGAILARCPPTFALFTTNTDPRRSSRTYARAHRCCLHNPSNYHAIMTERLP